MSTSAWMPVKDDAASAWKPVQQQTSEPPAPPDSTWQGMKEAGGDVLDFVKGAGKGALHTLSATDDFARQHLPSVLTNSNMGFGPPANLEHIKQMATPQNIPQNLGYGLEQVGEFLTPAGAEEKLASLAPKAIKPLARIATGALSSGLVNKAQGGEFSTGAMTGAAGGAVGEGLRSLAPKIAESAIGIGKGDRAFGKAPGEAILRDTRGIRPSTIAESGQETLNRLTPQLESMVAASPNAASLAPARQVVTDATGKAIKQNAQSLHGQLTPMTDFLTRRFNTNAPIPQNVPPSDLLDLKRGFSKEFLGRWNPETHGDTIGTGRRAYGALDSELDRTVPEAKPLNQRISSLIPAVHRADSTARNAPMAQKVVGRFLAPTGALTAAAFGASQGASHGLGGAIAGGATGLLTPLVVGTPEGQMLAARAFNSSGTGKAIRALVTPGTQHLLDYIREQKKGTGGQGQ